MKIGFAARNSWNPISWLIQIITKSHWSHCFIVTDMQIAGDNIILEDSMAGGVKFNLLSVYQKNHTLQLYDIKAEYTLDALHPYIGDNYAYAGILGEAIAKLLKLKRNPITLDMVCSGLCLKFLKSGPLADMFNGLDIHTTSPQDLFDIISRGGPFNKL